MNISPRNPIIYLEPWYSTAKIGIIYTFLQIVTSPMTCLLSSGLPWLHDNSLQSWTGPSWSTKIWPSNDASNHLISLLYILCSSIRCLDIIEFFKVAKKYSCTLWDLFMFSPLFTCMIWFINWLGYLINFLATMLQYSRTNWLERFKWATLLKKHHCFD